MKRKILLLMLLCPIFIFGQTWDYPVKPGTEEWRKFQSNQEMVDACQIPEEVLLSISTDDLMKLCLNYPLLYDVFAFNNTNEGLDKLFSDFNGIREFYKREDAFEKLLGHYKTKMNNLSLLKSNDTDMEKGLFIIYISALEVLMSYESNIGEKASKELLRNLVIGYEEKSKYTDFFKGFGFRTNLYSRAKLILQMDKRNLMNLPQTDKNPVFTSGFTDEKSVEIIDVLSYELIK